MAKAKKAAKATEFRTQFIVAAAFPNPHDYKRGYMVIYREGVGVESTFHIMPMEDFDSWVLSLASDGVGADNEIIPFDTRESAEGYAAGLSLYLRLNFEVMTVQVK